MDERKQAEQSPAPYLQNPSNGFESPSIDYGYAAKRLGLDQDLAAARARMSERDGLKLDAILETHLERMDFREREQGGMRDGRLGEEIKAVKLRLAQDGLMADPRVLRKEARTNVEKLERGEKAVIRREAAVHVEDHQRRTLGHDQAQMQRHQRRQ
ncbi:MAG: hypothetical protein AAGA97_00920 [Pseudomonadota bacterium]